LWRTTGIYLDETVPAKALELADAVVKDEARSAEDKVAALAAGLRKAVRAQSLELHGRVIVLIGHGDGWAGARARS